MATQRVAGRGSSRRYSEVEKAQAVRLVRALRAELGTDRGTVRRVADHRRGAHTSVGDLKNSIDTWIER